MREKQFGSRILITVLRIVFMSSATDTEDDRLTDIWEKQDRTVAFYFTQV